MKKFSEQVLSPHKHMSKKASPYHAHSQGLVYTPKGKEEVRPIDTADAGYGGEAVADAQGGEANPGKASKKAVSPMKMQTLVKANEETERERLMKLRSFAAQQKHKGLGKAMVEEEQIDELKKSTLASYAKKATDDVSYHSFTAGTMSAKDPERLAQDKKAMRRQSGVIKAIDRLAKEDVELDERNMENKAKKDNVVRQVGTHAYIKHGTDAGSPKMTGRKVMSDPKIKSSKIADMYRKLPSMEEATNVTDYNPKSQGGTRVELLQKLAKSKNPEHAAAARKAGATQGELKKAMMAEADDWNGPAEENDMALTQLHFIHYAAEEIIAAVEAGTDMEEWYQNKLSKLHGDMESLYSYMQGRQRFTGTLGDPMMEGKMKDIATDKAEDERLAAQAVLGGPVKSKASAIGGPGQPKSARNLAKRLATKAMKAGHSVSEEKKSKVPRIGPMEKALEEEEVWDKPMPDSKKQGSLSAEQKAKAKARAERAGRSYPNMIDNMWASKQ